MEQTNIFDFTMENYKIQKKIRLITLFSGIGFQEMALRDLELDFEMYKTCEWDVHPIASAKAIHKPKDFTDYSEKINKDELVDMLYDLGISNDGKVPMKQETIKRKHEDWLRMTFNNIKAMNNLVNITKVHGNDLEIVDKDKYCYFVTYSFPCQDLSKAGKQKGMSKGNNTRSGLLWELERILKESKEDRVLPDILLMENVPDVAGTKNIKDFNAWQYFLESIGYTNHVMMLNSKDYSIPQNRNRCFMVSILGNYNYEYPKPVPLKLRLKDMLEKEVDERYYLSQSQIEYFEKHTKECEEKGLGFRFKPTEGDGISRTCTTHPSGLRMDDNFVKVIGNTNPSGRGLNGNVSSGGLAPTLTTNKGEGPKIIIEGSLQGGITTVQKDNLVIERGIAIKEATKQGYATAVGGDSINLEQPNSKTRRGRVGKGVAQTLTTSCNQGVIENAIADGIYLNDSDDFNRGPLRDMSRCIKAQSHDAGVVQDNYRIRKLTPLECWRLMGATDDDFYKAAKVNPNSQLYKQAGNGIVKHVLMAIIAQMIPDDYEFK